MANIYIWFTSEKFQEYGATSDEITEQLLYFNKLLGKPLMPLDKWVAPTLVPTFPEGSKNGKLKPLGDFVPATNPYVLSQRAVDGLGGVFERYGKLYPLKIEGQNQTYFMFVCENIVNCLDYQNSKVKRSVVDPSKITTVMEPVFLEDKIGDNLIFAIPDDPNFCYVTEEFRVKVKEANLKGLKLCKVWFDSNPWYS